MYCSYSKTHRSKWNQAKKKGEKDVVGVPRYATNQPHLVRQPDVCRFKLQEQRKTVFYIKETRWQVMKGMPSVLCGCSTTLLCYAKHPTPKLTHLLNFCWQTQLTLLFSPSVTQPDSHGQPDLLPDCWSNLLTNRDFSYQPDWPPDW
jgi:hypothetical protein